MEEQQGDFRQEDREVDTGKEGTGVEDRGGREREERKLGGRSEPHVIVMVGLPARGKTYIAKKLARWRAALCVLYWAVLYTVYSNAGVVITVYTVILE